VEMVERLANLIEKKSRIFVLTGAGISTESGIPDFRSPQGLYSKYPQDMFDIQFLKNNPGGFYKIFTELLNVILSAEPNYGHILLSKLEGLNKILLIATQNIDGLHQMAGSQKIAELHGNAKRFFCEKCNNEYNYTTVLELLKTIEVPLCSCGGIIRPDVVFFGEPLKEESLRVSFEMAMASDLFIVMGSSLVVYPAASLPLVALEEKIPLVIINKGETQYDPYCTLKLEGPIGTVSFEVMKIMGL